MERGIEDRQTTVYNYHSKRKYQLFLVFFNWLRWWWRCWKYLFSFLFLAYSVFWKLVYVIDVLFVFCKEVLFDIFSLVIFLTLFYYKSVLQDFRPPILKTFVVETKLDLLYKVFDGITHTSLDISYQTICNGRHHSRVFWWTIVK